MAAVDMGAGNGPPGPTDDLDDLFDYNVDNDIFRDVDTNMNVPAISTTANKAGGKENDSGLGIDQEVKVTRKRAPVPKLDIKRLLSPAGIPKLRRVGKERIKFKGKGHEYSDVARLLNFYQLWLDDLYPRAKFADGLAMIEKLGHSRDMHTMRKEWINEGKPTDSLEDLESKVSTPSDEQRAAGSAQRPSTAEKPVERPRTASAMDASNDDLYGATPSVAEDEIASQRMVNGSEELFISDTEEAGNGPPEDDLDALWASNQITRDDTGGVQQDKVHGNDSMDKNFDDEMEAMGGFEDLW